MFTSPLSSFLNAGFTVSKLLNTTKLSLVHSRRSTPVSSLLPPILQVIAPTPHLTNHLLARPQLEHNGTEGEHRLLAAVGARIVE